MVRAEIAQRVRRAWGPRFKKGIATLLIASLLVTQQGFLFVEALAQNVQVSPGAVSQSAAGVGFAGAAVQVVPLSPQSLSLSPQGIGLSRPTIVPGATPSLPAPAAAMAFAAPALVPSLAMLAQPGSTPASSPASAHLQAAHQGRAPPAAAPAATAAQVAILRAQSAAAPALGQGQSRTDVPAVGPSHPVADVASRPQAQTASKPQGIEELEPNTPGLGKRVQARLRRALGWDGGPPVEDPLIGEKIDVTPWLTEMLKSDDPEVMDRLLAIFPQLWDKPLDEPAEAPKTLADVSLTPEPGRKYSASPEDWRDEVFYSIFVDRFSRGGEAKPWGDPRSGQTWHGGNIPGVIDKLDYLKGLGVTTLMLTSVVMSAPGGYHGYWPVHMMAIDPHYGTMADYKRLVAEAHKRGMRVVMDLAVNHVGKVFAYEDNNHWGPIRRIVRWLRRFKPLELAQEEHFYRRGVINNWDDPDQAMRGDFPPDLRHFDVENPATQDLLIKMAKWWIMETDIDGFRLDAYRHMHRSFWSKFHSEIREFAAGLGKSNFLQMGELSVGLDGDLSDHLGPGKLDSALAYPAHRKDNAALHGLGPTRMLEDSFWSAANTLGEGAKRLLRFIDNHDTYRFMREGTPAGVFKVALAYLLFSTGIPMVYAGTEQAVRQAIETMAPENPGLPADPHNREDLFAGGEFKSRWTQGDALQAGTQAYEQFRRLAELRKTYPALRRGEQYVRWSDPNGAGIFAFSRIYQGQEVLVVLNTSGDPRSAEMWVDGGVTPAQTPLVDALDGGYGTGTYATPGGGSKVKVDVPAHGVRVLVRRSQ